MSCDDIPSSCSLHMKLLTGSTMEREGISSRSHLKREKLCKKTLQQRNKFHKERNCQQRHASSSSSCSSSSVSTAKSVGDHEHHNSFIKNESNLKMMNMHKKKAVSNSAVAYRRELWTPNHHSYPVHRLTQPLSTSALNSH